MTASMTCDNCATELRELAKFCDACGSPVWPVTDSAEYKQVTILFADVVGSMGLAAGVGAERLREIMSELVSRCAVVVRRYGGILDKFTGDGVMALFGAPNALEDHAIRGCLAAMAIQREIQRLGADLDRRDGISLKARVGLNSGQVIVGDIGSNPFSYTAIGEHVGKAQRMESAAPPGGVMLTESTAQLVAGAVMLDEPEWVYTKDSHEPVRAWRVIGQTVRRERVGRESTLVGRTLEISMMRRMLDDAVGGSGRVVGVVGAPGIGKSRLIREMSAIATRHGVEVFTAYCESHTREIPSHTVAQLLREVFGVDKLDHDTARIQIRVRVRGADSDDLLLLDDLLGIRNVDIPLPDIDPDARRRRLTQLVKAAAVAREAPALFVVEDAHWIDGISDFMLAEFLAAIRRMRSLVLVTYRPEYTGALKQLPDIHTVALTPLDDSQTSALTAELLGSHPSVAALATQVSARAAGNPFFAEEIVRELAQRGVIEGDQGNYTCVGVATEVPVPATLSATIAARIDRLDLAAKRTLNAAAVIGSRFTKDLLDELLDASTLDELLDSELVEQVGLPPRAEYAFCHPMIRAVAYESQLMSVRARLHRSLAEAIVQRDPESADANAALIAEHLEAAGELRESFGWHMRAGGFSTSRDITAARMSWQRARNVVDRLPTTDPDRTALQIAPRTLLCGTAWRAGGIATDNDLDELRTLTATADDRYSLAVAIAGLLPLLTMNGRFRESSRLASELAGLLESIGDPTMIVGLLYGAIYAKGEAGEMAESMRLAQRVIDLADGDPAKGNMILGSPLALAYTVRGVDKCALGLPDWREDMDVGVVMARPFDPTSRALVVIYKYAFGITTGALLPDAAALRETAEALEVAEQSGDDFTLWLARVTRGMALVHWPGRQRDSGLELLEASRQAAATRLSNVMGVMMIDVHVAAEALRSGDVDGAIELSRKVIDDQYDTGEMLYRGRAALVLVEALLARDGVGDQSEAQAVIDRLAAVPTDPGFVVFDIPLLRMRALLARARGDAAAYADYSAQYRVMATACGFDGHAALARAMS